jgi:hypothetical protein
LFEAWSLAVHVIKRLYVVETEFFQLWSCRFWMSQIVTPVVVQELLAYQRTGSVCAIVFQQ